MKIKDALKIAIKVLNEQPPERAFKAGSVAEAAKALNTILRWAYPELDSANIKQVVHCKDCVYYKRYRKKDAFKSGTIWLCSMDKTKKRPEFYCKEGVHR